jgi:hypothetical protein
MDLAFESPAAHRQINTLSAIHGTQQQLADYGAVRFNTGSLVSERPQRSGTKNTRGLID